MLPCQTLGKFLVICHASNLIFVYINVLNQSLSRTLVGLLSSVQRLQGQDWRTLGRPTFANISVFVYIALAPMGDISLKPYPAVQAWIERIGKLPGFTTIPGLNDPLIRRDRWYR